MFGKYPEGGGMVGTANDVYRNRSSGPQYSSGGGDGMDMLAKGLRAYGMQSAASEGATGSLTGSTPAWTSQVMGGGSAMPAGGGMGGGFGTITQGAGGSAAGGAGGGGMGSMLSSAGPWAALAAAIYMNEKDSDKKGLRDKDPWGRTKDTLTGKVLVDDIEGKWGPKLDDWTGGKFSDSGLKGDWVGGAKIAGGNLKGGLQDLYKEGIAGKVVKGLKGLF